MKLELFRTKNNKVLYILAGVILACFILSWILLTGLNKNEYPSYRAYLHTTYTVFTQFGFMMFSFLFVYTIAKDYSDGNILFYKLLGDNSLTYFLKKIVVLAVQTLCTLAILLIIVSTYYDDFSAFFQSLYLYFSVVLQHMLIISVISMYCKTSTISLASSIGLWLVTIISTAMFDSLKNIAFFDASSNFYVNVTRYFQSTESFMSMTDNFHVISYITIILLISLVGAVMANKIWLKHGV